MSAWKVKLSVLLSVLLLASYSCSRKSGNFLNDYEKESYSIQMIRVDGGTFVMGNKEGDKDEKPEHKVRLDAFFISAHEITNGQYCKFLNETEHHLNKIDEWIDLHDLDSRIKYNRKGYYPEPGYTNHPVIEVTWYGAKAFCEWSGGRLPTEAEWEFAARGGLKSENYKYSGSDIPGKVAWYDQNSLGTTHIVGTKSPNELRIYDMSGNVWEWCFDYYSSDYYNISKMDNPQGAEWGTGKVVRGGSWGYNQYYLRTTYRKLNSPDAGNFNLGFRLVRDIQDGLNQEI